MSSSRLINASLIIDNITPQEWTVDKILPNNGLFEIFGESGSYKSFIVLDMLVCISQSIPWHGHKTNKKLVIYVAGEGAYGVKIRLKALSLKYQTSLDNFYLLPIASNLSDGDEIKKLCIDIQLINDQQEKIIVFDTLHRNSSADENSSTDYALVLKNIDNLLFPQASIVGFVHHSGYAAIKRSRGTSSRFASLDTCIMVTRQKDLSVKIECTKQKDYDEFSPIYLTMCKCDIGIFDEKQQPITSLVPCLSLKNETVIKSKILQHDKDDYELIALLSSLVEKYKAPIPYEILTIYNYSKGFCVSEKVWKKEYLEGCNNKPMDDKSKDAKRKKFDRKKKILIDNNIIGVENGLCWICRDCR